MKLTTSAASLIAIVWFFLPVAAQASAIFAAPNNLGLVGYWKFDEGSGTTARDYSGRGNTGTLSGSTLPSWVAGKLGNALSFNGTNSYASTTASSAFDFQGDFSISFWQKPTAINAVSRTLEKRPDTGTDGGWTTYLVSGKNAYANIGGNGVTGNTTVTANQWSHVAYVRSGSTLTIYYNGVSDGSGTLSGSPSVVPIILRIGWGDDVTRYYPGSIDEVRVYNRALSAGEVSALYNSAKTTHTAQANTVALSSGLVGYWTLDGGATNWRTNTTADSSGNGNTGTLVSLATSTAPVAGKIGQALRFNGSNSHVSVGTSNALNVQNAPFSVSAWVNTRGAPSSLDKNQPIITRGDGLGATFAYMAALNSALQPEFSIYDDSGNNPTIVSTNAISSNGWHHVVGVYNGINVNLYVDGVVAQTPVSKGGYVNPSFSSEPAYIGRWANDATRGYFNGTIDDVRIYNRALSAQEVKQLYTLGTANVAHSNTVALSNGLVGYWTFDGGAMNWRTNTTADMSGNGNTGTLVSMSTSTSPVAGKIGQALKFNGSTSFVNTSSNGGISSSVGTVSAWVKPNTLPSVIIVFVKVSRDPNRIYLEQTTSGNLAIGLGATHPVDSGQALPLGQWTHTLLTWNNGTYFIYKNGVSVATGSYSSLSGITTCPSIGAYTDVCGIPTGVLTSFFNGTIDDVRIYNRALSAQEVQQLYLMGSDLSRKEAPPLWAELLSLYANEIGRKLDCRRTTARLSLPAGRLVVSQSYIGDDHAHDAEIYATRRQGKPSLQGWLARQNG